MDLLLSPHADDIAYSIGGILVQKYIANATLVTVFQRSSYLPFVETVSSVEEAMAIRYKEDFTFAKKLDLNYGGLGLNDTTQRGYDLDLIFKLTDYRQDPDSLKIIQALHSFFDQCVEITRLWVPLAIGNHIDHLLVLNAVLEWQTDYQPELIFYEDIPYAAWQDLNDIETLVHQKIKSAKPENIDVSECFEEKLENLKIYVSQVSPDDIESVKFHAQRILSGLAVERIWRKIKE